MVRTDLEIITLLAFIKINTSDKNEAKNVDNGSLFVRNLDNVNSNTLPSSEMNGLRVKGRE